MSKFFEDGIGGALCIEGPDKDNDYEIRIDEASLEDSVIWLSKEQIRKLADWLNEELAIV